VTDKDKRPRARSSRVGFYSIVLGICWTCTVLVSFLWNLHLLKQETREVAVNVARAYLLSDNRYRRWNALHGGIYIPSDNGILQRSLPFDVEEPEIISPSGRKLILADHAYMMDQVYELSSPAKNVRGELKSLDPISKRGAANDWETAALKSLANGKKEVGEVLEINNEQVVFLMRPFVIEEPCLKCHAKGGYKVGDIRGGISVRIPLTQFGITHNDQLKMLWWGHMLWWMLGALGIIISYLGMRSRVYERERAETALEKLRRQQEQVLSAAGEGIYGVDTKGITTFVNPAAAKMLGWEPEELIGRSQHNTIHHTKPDGTPYPEEDCPISYSIYDGKIHQGTDEWYIRKNGSTFPIDYISTPVIENGVIIGAVITFADITERKKADEDMAKAQLYLQNIINAMPSILIGVDMQGSVTLWNKEATEVTGFEPEEAYGKDLKEVCPMLIDKIPEIKDAVLEQNVQKMESVFSTPQKGEGHFIDIIIYPLKLESYRGAVIRIDDVSERVMMEDRLVQSEKITSVVGLVEGMAHEINNPLGGIIQGAQNVLRRLSPELPKNVEVAKEHGVDLVKVGFYMSDRQIPKFLEGIRSSGKRASDIISYMLQFSQVHQAPKELRNLERLLNSLLDLNVLDEEDADKFDFDKIELVKEYDPDLPDVPCITSEIEQVMRNVIRNSAQAILEQENPPAEPKIILRTIHEVEENMILIEVEDNGPGMDETVQRRIFEPFFTTKPPGEGIGLGLAVSYFLITVAHQGTMDVESELGKGAKFSIRLPLNKK
jgi:PAS domain S-box-containing protein